jgi:hypothetical protein
MNYRPKKKKMSALEKKELRRQHLAHALNGDGAYIFENITKGDLWLPKPSFDGSKGPIPSKGRWKGDSYFIGLVKSGDARIIETCGSKPTESQEKNMQERLLVDQPDRLTVEGVVEQIVKSDHPLNEGEPIPDPKNSILINEDPLQGVEILID